MILHDELEKLFTSLPHNENINMPIKQGGIALYGAGAMCEMALDFLRLINVIPKYIIDSNKKGKLRDNKIITPLDIPKNDLENLTFILCIVTTPITPIINFLHNLGCKDVRHFYDYTEIMLENELTNGWSCLNPTKKDINAIKSVCNNLKHDKYSLAHYIQFLWWRLRRIEKIYKEYPVLSNRKYFKAPCMPKFTDSERFFDAGAHFGTTIKKFIEVTNSKFNYIWAIEPDERNFNIMKENLQNISNIEYLPIALSNNQDIVKFIDNLGFASKIKDSGKKIIKTQAIDNLDINPTIIKLHIEGYELLTLYGAVKTIKKHRPILMILADHNRDGLYKIAHLLMTLNKYKIYFYLHDYCGNSAIFYAIPEEKLDNE